MAVSLKPVEWLGSSHKDLLAMPEEVQRHIGFTLYLVQCGRMPPEVKPLKGYGGANVQEIIVDYDTDTYRAVYTLRYPTLIYMLHVFKKKSKSGRATPKRDIELIERRLKFAQDLEKNRRT